MHIHAYVHNRCMHTGIGLGAGSVQLAGGVLVVSWGCSGGVQRSCGDHLHPTQLRLQGKMVDLANMHLEMGWICPMWPSTPLATKAPICKKPCRLAVCLITD